MFPEPNAVITASRDHTVRVWRKTGDNPPAYECNIVTQGQEYINSVAYIAPSSDYENGLIVSGGKDTIIEVKKPNTSPGDNAERLLIGHAHNICSLDVSPKATYIVSGSWDKQAIVWKVGKWEPEFILTGHDASVWGVLALDETTVVTGAADEKIHIYDLRSAAGGQVEPRATIHTSDVVRAVVKVPEAHPSGAEIASAHNDGVIRLWKLNGQSVGELHGHESFVYSLASLPTGELVSAGEDRTVRIWRGAECVQTITVPAISVWSVSVCKRTGDIVAGSSDGVARVFTKSPENVADAETLAAFEESVKASSIPQQQMESFNKEKIPGPDFLKSKSGTKEGQVQMIKEDNGSVTAHQWSMGKRIIFGSQRLNTQANVTLAQQQWICVGTVVDAVGSSGKKAEYNGKSYDYVFDVDIEDGAPPLKLPYNLSENPYEAAMKFLGDNELPMTYLDNVTNFIVENTKGATIGQSSAPAPGDFGTGRYQPGDSGESSQPPAKKVLPQEKYLTLATAKFEPVVKKIMSISATMVSTGRKDFALNPIEEGTLNRLTQSLAQTIPSVPASLLGTAPAESASKEASEHEISLILKLVQKWQDNDRLPGLDLLRCMVTAAGGISDDSGNTAVDIALQAAFHPTSGGNINENCAMMAFRVVTNLFVDANGREIAYKQAEKVVDYMECLVGASDTVFKGPVGFPGNRNVLMAVTTAALNYSVLGYLVSKKKVAVSDGSIAVTPEVFGLMANVLAKIIKEQHDAEVNYRALAALGTLAAAGNAEVIKALGADEAVRVASKDQNAEQRVRSIASECLSLLI